MSIPHNNLGPPPAGPPPPNNNGPPPMVRPNGPAPRLMEELCHPSIDGRGGPISPIPIKATDFGLRHHMIQQVQNTCQFHGLPGNDANRHIDKFLEITQHMKQNGVSDDALRLSLFLYSFTHHAITWYDRLPRNSIHSFDDMMRKFLSKYFPPSMTPEECYELIENKTAHHNHWDTSTTQDETSRNISSTTTTTTESPEVVRQLEMMNKNFVEMMRQIQTIKSVDTNLRRLVVVPIPLPSAQSSMATLKRPLMLLRKDSILQAGNPVKEILLKLNLPDHRILKDRGEVVASLILMEDDFKPVVQHQRRVNPKIHEVIKKEVIKLLDAGLIYPISDSPWVSFVHCMPKKGGMTVVENEDNELIPTRLVMGWRVCIDYRKLNDATRKDHFPLPFMD
ncbi:hypothetical protein Tco_0664581 [Tanacetum coccineum]